MTYHLLEEENMQAAERRQLTRHNHRTPLRFRSTGVVADRSDHFTEALNISRGGFYFASSAPLQVGMPIEVTVRDRRDAVHGARRTCEE
jgi:hypothetical protein